MESDLTFKKLNFKARRGMKETTEILKRIFAEYQTLSKVQKEELEDLLNLNDQEIFARVTYLGKKNKAAVIFANAKSPITDVAGKKIGKEVFSKNFENLTLHHYYIEKNDYFVEGEQISPYASQW